MFKERDCMQDLEYFIRLRLQKWGEKVSPEIKKFSKLLEDGKLRAPILRQTYGSFGLVDALLFSIDGFLPGEFVERKWISPLECKAIEVLKEEVESY